MEKQQMQYVNREGKFLAKVKRPGNGWLGMEASGSEFVRVPLIVTDAGDQIGREIVWKGYLTEKATERTCKTLDDIFGKEWDMKTLEGQKVQWEGTEVRITVEGQEYNGEVRYRVKWLNPAKTVAVEADRIAQLDAKLAAIRGGAPAAAKEGEGDEISF